jgi:hypothetical protein
MRRKVFVPVALVLLCSSVFAADDPKPKAMSAEEKAGMEAMMKAMMPGENHKLLDNMVGRFDVKVTTWMQPGGAPMVSTGKADNAWVLGNRYVEQKFNGDFMGMPYSGLGYVGYDNVKKQFWSTWVDNMSTGIMVATGATADSGRSWKFAATMSDPMTGKDGPVEQKVTVADHDHHSMEMWTPGPDGKMFKMMEIAYTRSK